MGAAKTISQGNPPSDDTMYQQEKAAGQGKYMRINKKKLRVKEILRKIFLEKLVLLIGANHQTITTLRKIFLEKLVLLIGANHLRCVLEST
jgi:hypothetical protein